MKYFQSLMVTRHRQMIEKLTKDGMEFLTVADGLPNKKWVQKRKLREAAKQNYRWVKDLKSEIERVRR